MRYAIKGERPGTTVHVAGRFVALDPTDGGAEFTDEQLEELAARGHELVRVSKDAPLSGAEQREADVEAQNRIAANAAAAREHNDQVNRPARRATFTKK